MAGQVVDPLGGLEIRPAHGFRQLEISRAGADEGGHMPAATEHLAEVVAVSTNIKSLRAVNAKANDGKGDFQNLIAVDADLAGGSIDHLALTGQFIKGNPVLFDGGDHGRDLIEFTGEFGKSGIDGRPVQGGDGFGFEDFACGVLGVGGFPEFQRALVLFVLRHEQVLDAGGFANDKHKESGGDGIERAAVANLTLVKAASDEVDNVVGGATGGFVDQEQAIKLGDHGNELSFTFTITFTGRPEWGNS